jgi:hypothetical protein
MNALVKECIMSRDPGQYDAEINKQKLDIHSIHNYNDNVKRLIEVKHQLKKLTKGVDFFLAVKVTVRKSVLNYRINVINIVAVTSFLNLVTVNKGKKLFIHGARSRSYYIISLLPSSNKKTLF